MTATDELNGAWNEYLDRLRMAGETIIGDHGATNDLEAAEGYRFLTRLSSGASDMFLEYGDSSRPEFVRLLTNHRKFYGDNPDTFYDLAPIRGKRTYRISGRRGTSEYLAACVYGKDDSGATRIVANTSDRDFPVDDEGRFDLYLSTDPPPETETGHWVELAPDADTVIVRQYFLDRSTETPADFSIDCLDEVGPPGPLRPDLVARKLRAAGEFVSNAALFSGIAAQGLAERPNEWSVDSEAGAVVAFYPTPDNKYVASWYRLNQDQALVIEGTPPDTRYWSLLLMSRWMESLDTQQRQTILNNHQVELEPDGTFRIVVAHQNPGTANWLDTAGHAEGYVMFRWMQATGITRPSSRVVSLESLRS